MQKKQLCTQLNAFKHFSTPPYSSTAVLQLKSVADGFAIDIFVFD
jgi:hypothetical protein